VSKCILAVLPHRLRLSSGQSSTCPTGARPMDCQGKVGGPAVDLKLLSILDNSGRNQTLDAKPGKARVGWDVPSPQTPRRFLRGVGSRLFYIDDGGGGGDGTSPPILPPDSFEGFCPLGHD
jgi:hypothetical protein